jgi:hypothetical protein
MIDILHDIMVLSLCIIHVDFKELLIRIIKME